MPHFVIAKMTVSGELYYDKRHNDYVAHPKNATQFMHVDDAEESRKIYGVPGQGKAVPTDAELIR